MCQGISAYPRGRRLSKSTRQSISAAGISVAKKRGQRRRRMRARREGRAGETFRENPATADSRFLPNLRPWSTVLGGSPSRLILPCLPRCTTISVTPARKTRYSLLWLDGARENSWSRNGVHLSNIESIL